MRRCREPKTNGSSEPLSPHYHDEGFELNHLKALSREIVALVIWLLVVPLIAQDRMEVQKPPSAATDSLPEPEGIISRVMARAKTVSRLAEAYCYREEQTEENLDSKGNSTKSTVSLFDVIHFSGGKIRRLIAVDGKPIDPERAQLEEAKVQARLKKMEEINPKPEPNRTGNEITLSVEDLLAVSEVRLLSRTEHKGQLVLVLSFQPKKGTSPKGMGQRLAAKLEGRIFVEESSDQVVWAEGRLIESFWVGGGLLGALLPPSTFVFEQQRVVEGLWMPVQGTFILYGRVTFVPVRRKMTFRCSDFRQFVIEGPEISKAALFPN